MTTAEITRTETPRAGVVRAGEAAARTGLAGDAATMLAIVLANFPAAHAGELTEDIDLAVFAGEAVAWVHRDVVVVETGAQLLG